MNRPPESIASIFLYALAERCLNLLFSDPSFLQSR